MKLPFYKYQGTGNDFVMIDDRQKIFPCTDSKYIAFLCDRKIGIGADGLILLQKDSKTDFKMVYFNSDGNESSMCGNGGRCLVAFAHYLGIIGNTITFNAIDGVHTAEINNNDIVRLQMQDVANLREKQNYTFLDTGSPHHVQLVDNLAAMDVAKEGAKLRYGLYGQKGSNINFVEPNGSNSFAVRTYERGVENETLSCGTGVTAVALAMHHAKKTDAKNVKMYVQGGELEVEFNVDANGYSNIFLIGSATMVFKGEIECKS